MTNFPHGGKSEIFFLPYVLDLIDLIEANILSGFQIEGKTYVWISQVRRVKEKTYLKINTLVKNSRKNDVFWHLPKEYPRPNTYGSHDFWQLDYPKHSKPEIYENI